MNKQKQALEFLKQNVDVLEEALLYWSAKDYNGQEAGDELIKNLYEIVGLEVPKFDDDFSAFPLVDEEQPLFNTQKEAA